MPVNALLRAESKNIHEMGFKVIETIEYPNSKFKMIYYWDSDCATFTCDCDSKSLSHKCVFVESENLIDCYTKLMKKVHQVFECQKCHSISINDINDKIDIKKEKICSECAIHLDMYSNLAPIIKKGFLFDCYICGMENINIKYKAKLNCFGASRHNDFICKSCFLKCRRKCPVCR
jgi:hypothetical protein